MELIKVYTILGLATAGIFGLFWFFPLTTDPDTVWCNNHGGRVFEAKGLGGNDVCVFPPKK